MSRKYEKRAYVVYAIDTASLGFKFKKIGFIEAFTADAALHEAKDVFDRSDVAVEPATVADEEEFA
jgi:1,2-phenylacetyl-CoA epoxidase PaaB subunit